MRFDRKDFAAFFRELHGGHDPFAWQERLLDYVLERGRWPARVVAPTGSGKTAIIDVHVFAQALCAQRRSIGEPAPSLPRRLAMVVDRRVLVDDQYECARRIASRLAAADSTAVTAEIAVALWTMRVPDDRRRELAVATPGWSPLVVGRLRGGSPPSRSWRDHPTAAAVLCATPDMWGSRLLFRGYGSSRLAWGREAGLLAVDSVVVVDEAHLAQQLLCTARRVEHLVGVTEEPPSWGALQVVETTATPSSAMHLSDAAIGVQESDLADSQLSARLTRPKPVTLFPVPDWDSTRTGAKSVASLADAVVALLPGAPPTDGPTHTVGCFVNTVGRAVAVAAELRRRDISGRTPQVVTVCGQIRPIDLDRLRSRHVGVLDPVGCRAVMCSCRPRVSRLASTWTWRRW